MDKIVVLISGRGSNLGAICKAGLADQISCVISNSATAKGLAIATQHNIKTHIIDHKMYKTREDFDANLAKYIDEISPSLVVLAGFMRILTPWFVNHYENKLINIHPSLLPAFIGTSAQKDALNLGVRASGATVHFVTNNLDAGPIIAQGVVPVFSSDSVESLKARILELEHVIYPFVIDKILAKKVRLANNSLTGNTTVAVERCTNDQDLLGKFAAHIFY